MKQYLLLVHGNAKNQTTKEDWDVFFTSAKESGYFRGGSKIGERVIVGDAPSAQSSKHIVGYMRFDSNDKLKLLELLQKHPVALRGGSLELCEMPKS